jgi:IS30 family transposase
MAGNYKYLTLDDRRRIAGWYINGERACDIAARIGVHTATIYNELQRGGTGGLDRNQRPAYDPDIAQRTVQEGFKRRGRRPKIAEAAEMG